MSARSFAVLRRKRLVTLVIAPESTDSEVPLAAAYDVASALAIESVRHLRDGDWDEVARRVEAVEQAVEGIVEARAAFDSIEKRAHDGAAASAKRHALLVRLVAELAAVVRVQ
jgi:coenzyme F420-reducing hydrogenase beta subunit